MGLVSFPKVCPVLIMPFAAPDDPRSKEGALSIMVMVLGLLVDSER